jgi:hypothetical protein
MAWKVIIEPVGENPTAEGLNDSGLGVVLANGEARKELSRVAFVRRNSAHPRVSFGEQLRKELARAEVARDELNENLAELEDQRRQVVGDALDKLAPAEGLA